MELQGALTAFQLCLAEKEEANNGAAVGAVVDGRLRAVGGWVSSHKSGIQWTKSHEVKGTRVCIAVRVQFAVSAASDLLFIDLQYLCDEIIAGCIDIGVIVVPSNKLAYFLTDRVARYSDAVKAVERARASDLPLAVLALEHDGPGPALMKRQTRQGKKTTL
ncbi:MAG: hypothetical protein ACREQW_25880 [Candidatus Binatia bacterium]